MQIKTQFNYRMFHHHGITHALYFARIREIIRDSTFLFWTVYPQNSDRFIRLRVDRL